MSEHATAFEQQAIANIAAEMPISVVFMRHTPGRIGTRTSPVSPKNYAEIDEAVRALANPPHVQEFITTHAGILQLAMSGFVEHDRGYLVMLAGSHILPKKPEELRSWVTMMASAWAGLVADHISMLNSTGTVAAPRMEYLAARFSIDETNLWLLAEESGEVVRGCGKIGRWGYDHVHQVTGESGMRLLEAEVGDFLGIVDIMVARGHFTVEGLEAAKLAKLERLEKWYEAPPTPADMKPVERWAPAEQREQKAARHRTILSDAFPFDSPPAMLFDKAYSVVLKSGLAVGAKFQGITHADGTVLMHLQPPLDTVCRCVWLSGKWHEVPDVPTPVEMSPTTHSAKELIEGGWLAKVVLGDAPRKPATPEPKKKRVVTRLDGYVYRGWLLEEPAQPCGRMRMALGTDQLIWVTSFDGKGLCETTPPSQATPPGSPRRVMPFESPAGVPREPTAGLGAGPIGQSYSHVRALEPTAPLPSGSEELPRTPEGYLDWKALDGDLATVKQGVGGLLTVEVTKNGRMRVFTGVVATPITFNITPNP